MKLRFACCLLLVLAPLMSLGGCGCGFDCNSDSMSNPASLTLTITGESPQALKQVRVTVDSVRFGRSNGEDVLVETFTIAALGLADAETFQIDLLDYQGRNSLTIIEALELDVGSYNQIVFTILDGDVNYSYVQEPDDTLKEITVSGGELALPGVFLASGAESRVAVFGLVQALRYRSAEDDYLLASEGIRVEDAVTAARLSGAVDNTLFDTVTPCDEKEAPLLGNRIYLYNEAGLASESLGDVHTTASSTDIPAQVIAPYSVATLYEDAVLGGWQYIFGYLPQGRYTVALSCDAEMDDPVDYDGIVIPLPEAQVYEVVLSEAEFASCDFTDSSSCGN
jgi:hypothetical protein